MPKRMTIAEFFKVLPKSGWILADGELLGTRAAPSFGIYKARDIRYRRNRACPICTVANILAGKNKDHRIYRLDYDEAADAIGLPFFMAQRIVAAADLSVESDLYSKSMRARLLKHCGLV